MPSVGEMCRHMPCVPPESVCDAENDGGLDDSGNSQPAEGPAAEEPHGGSDRCDAASRARLKPPLHGRIPRLRRFVDAEKRSLHNAKCDEKLRDDGSGKCATGQKSEPLARAYEESAARATLDDSAKP